VGFFFFSLLCYHRFGAKNFLAKKAAEKAGVARTIDLDTLIPSAAWLCPAAGVALMVATKLEGRHINLDAVIKIGGSLGGNS